MDKQQISSPLVNHLRSLAKTTNKTSTKTNDKQLDQEKTITIIIITASIVDGTLLPITVNYGPKISIQNNNIMREISASQ